MRLSAIASLLIILYFKSAGQGTESKFLGTDYHSYLGSYFRMSTSAKAEIPYTFYDCLLCSKAERNTNVIYQSTPNRGSTLRDSLLNRVFMVERIIEDSSELSKIRNYPKTPVFVLRDTVSNKKIYYRYNMYDESDFFFITPVANTPVVKESDEYYCNHIEKIIDDFTGEVSYSSPLSDNVTIHKYISKGVTTYYISLQTIGYTLNVGNAGVIILFKDGSKWSKPTAKVDAGVGDDGWKYSAFIPITQTDLALFSSKAISKFRLYVYDQEMGEMHAESFKAYVKCIRASK